MANSPAAVVDLNSIGSVTLEDNRKTTEVITDLLNQKLNIPKEEIRIFFNDYSPDMVAMDGKVITDILAGK